MEPTTFACVLLVHPALATRARSASNMKTFLTVLFVIVFHDAIALALVYVAHGILWAATMLSDICEVI